MNPLLDHPAVQAGVLPFAVAFALAWPLARTRWLALAAGSGMVVLLALTVGFGFVPLTAVRKATLLILAAVAVALALQAAGVEPRLKAAGIVAALAAAATVWVLQRILEQAEGAAAWGLAIGAAAFVFTLTATALVSSADALRASVIGSALGWGSGALGILGASIFLGLAGVALGTACAAVALVLLLRGTAPDARWLVLPAALGSALVCVLAVALGQGRVYTMLPLLLVAPAARWADRIDAAPWQRALRLGVAAIVPVAAAVAWAWLDATPANPAG
jgi:hypothetical protein